MKMRIAIVSDEIIQNQVFFEREDGKDFGEVYELDMFDGHEVKLFIGTAKDHVEAFELAMRQYNDGGYEVTKDEKLFLL